MNVTRRHFCLAGPLTADAALSRLWTHAPAERTYGRITVTGWVAHKHRTGMELHVIFENEDVTYRCVRADDRRGYVVLNQHTSDGRCFIGQNGHVAREMLRGAVRIIEQRPEA